MLNVFYKKIIQDLKDIDDKKDIWKIIEETRPKELDEKMKKALTVGTWGKKKNDSPSLQMLQRLSFLQSVAKKREDDKYLPKEDDKYLPKEDDKYEQDEYNKYDQVE